MAKHTGRSGLARNVLGLPLAAALGWLGYSTWLVPHNMPLPPALSGDRRETNGRAGRVSYYVAGEGEPLLLIHSVNAAASAYEVRPLYEHYRQSRRVYALDLPGYGFSDRAKRDYTPRLMTDAILDLLDVIARDCGPEAVDAIGVSLGSEFLSRAGSERPDRFGSITLVTPTAFRAGEQYYGPPGSVRGSKIAKDVFDFPLWGQALFDLLNSPPSARFFLSQTFGSYETIDQGLLEYDYITAHQPNARNAPYHFVSGLLFSADIDRVYESLAMPVWLAYGTKGEFSDVSDTAAVEARGNWQIQSFDTGALPYFEQPDAFFAAYDTFLASSTSAR